MTFYKGYSDLNSYVTVGLTDAKVKHKYYLMKAHLSLYVDSNIFVQSFLGEAPLILLHKLCNS